MRLRFTIRDLLWLAVVVALAVGWWLDTVNLRTNLRFSYSEGVREGKRRAAEASTATE
jgi:hypothetical protein